MSDILIRESDTILKENQKDVEAARKNISPVMIDRLTLTEKRIADMAKGIREIADLPTPIGETISSVTRPNGLVIDKVSVPMGVIAIIYESRPNVTSDAAALCLKSGNVSVLRGGKEAYLTSRAIVEALRTGLKLAGLPEDAINLVSDTTRESANELMRAKGYVDLLIPRGGKGLISACVENATVPCLETGTGICHVYVDAAADLDKALAIIENAKTSRPSVCNAAEVLLVHEDVAEEFLPRLQKRLVTDRSENPVELRLGETAAQIIDGTPASDADFDTEFLDYILAVKVVSSVSEAVEHITLHSTKHSEAIITEDEGAMAEFTSGVDAAAVYVNASTRFTDGGEFGLGCEMGISTQKMHARGPLGIKELTTYKYVIRGNGQIR
jgi:glutamate-5-semialdehyde dehydrogenase